MISILLDVVVFFRHHHLPQVDLDLELVRLFLFFLVFVVFFLLFLRQVHLLLNNDVIMTSSMTSSNSPGATFSALDDLETDLRRRALLSLPSRSSLKSLSRRFSRFSLKRGVTFDQNIKGYLRSRRLGFSASTDKSLSALLSDGSRRDLDLARRILGAAWILSSDRSLVLFLSLDSFRLLDSALLGRSRDSPRVLVRSIVIAVPSRSRDMLRSLAVDFLGSCILVGSVLAGADLPKLR